MTRFPPTLLALLLILTAAVLSAVAVGVLAASPAKSALAVPTAGPAALASPTVLSGSIRGPLDGLPTPRQRADRAPIAAMIDNFVAARPQSGTGEASVVYEAPVEGGITRLMPIFLERDAVTLGPIRSARPYFVDWALPYHPLFVHDGGSPAAQSLIKSLQDLVDVDAARTGATFHRVQNRQAPHNLFTGTPAVRTLARLRNREMTGKLSPLPHQVDRKPPSHPTARLITIRFAPPGVTPNSDYTVGYRYDPADDAYLRSVGGTPSVDSLTGQQIRVSNVVVMVTSMKPIPNDPLDRISIRTTGSGTAYVFRSGERIAATWSKPSRNALLRLTNASGFPIRWNPGTSWIEVVSPGSVDVR